VGWLGRETDRDRNVARAALERTGTAHLVERRIEELSGGERQLVLIARALAQAAPVLLMDEPTAHLDLKHQVEILGLCRSLAHEDGHAVLLALHDLNLAAHFADRVALLSRGRLVAVGSPGTVLTEENLSRVYDLPVRIFPHPVHGTPVIFPDSEEGRSVGQPSAPPGSLP
jgi:iron complex transport system ATP-binding protein